MAKDKKTAGVWYWELDRFGYNLIAVGRTKEECVNTMIEEYIKTYAKWNELDEAKCRDALLSPILDEDGEVDELDEYNEFARCYGWVVDEECNCTFIEYGKVVWD